MFRIKVQWPPELLTEQRFKSAVDAAKKLLATHVYNYWMDLAGQELKTTFEAYRRGLSLSADDATGEVYVTLTGEVPLALEIGRAGPWDMKPGFLRSAKMAAQQARMKELFRRREVRRAAFARMHEEQPDKAPTRKWIIIPFGKTITRPRPGSGVVGLTHPIPPEPFRRALETLKRTHATSSRIVYLSETAYQRARAAHDDQGPNLTGYVPAHGRYERAGVLPSGKGGGISFRTLRDDAPDRSWSHPGFVARLYHRRAIQRAGDEHMKEIVDLLVASIVGRRTI